MNRYSQADFLVQSNGSNLMEERSPTVPEAVAGYVLEAGTGSSYVQLQPMELLLFTQLARSLTLSMSVIGFPVMALS